MALRFNICAHCARLSLVYTVVFHVVRICRTWVIHIDVNIFIQIESICFFSVFFFYKYLLDVGDVDMSYWMHCEWPERGSRLDRFICFIHLFLFGSQIRANRFWIEDMHAGRNMYGRIGTNDACRHHTEIDTYESDIFECWRQLSGHIILYFGTVECYPAFFEYMQSRCDGG